MLKNIRKEAIMADRVTIVKHQVVEIEFDQIGYIKRVGDDKFESNFGGAIRQGSFENVVVLDSNIIVRMCKMAFDGPMGRAVLEVIGFQGFEFDVT